jgi:hypothetical protein
MSKDVGGPLHVLENWLAADRGDPIRETVEVPFYSDAWITGAAENLHPYEIINLVPVGAPADAPTLILRMELHIDTAPSVGEKTDNSRFTGARSLSDELAALLSLSMGARISSGGITRHLGPQAGPHGRPTSDHSPRLPQRRHRASRAPDGFGAPNLLIPSALNPAGVDPGVLDLLHHTPVSAATSLLRAARAYRDALWIAEEEPALAWILFVSAVEAAAVHHRDASTNEPADVIRSSAPPKFIQALDRISPNAVSEVAPSIAGFFGSAARFRAFINDFFPPPPAQRPIPEFVRIDWSRESLSRAMGCIYQHRSHALHAGIPFPRPMYWHPLNLGGDVPPEKPLGGGAHGGHWTEDDCPMHLHIFEYIARQALMSWWRSMATAHIHTE